MKSNLFLTPQPGEGKSGFSQKLRLMQMRREANVGWGLPAHCVLMQCPSKTNLLNKCNARENRKSVSKLILVWLPYTREQPEEI
jgi:hypothetical protein